MLLHRNYSKVCRLSKDDREVHSLPFLTSSMLKI